jgi:hypothetical protein
MTPATDAVFFFYFFFIGYFFFVVTSGVAVAIGFVFFAARDFFGD